MKLLELKIEGFRSLRNVVWKPGDLNVLIGPNAGGKSNLLKALELLSASARGELPKQVASAGGMGAIVWDNGDSNIVCSAEMKSESDPLNAAAQYVLRIGRVQRTSGCEIIAESLSRILQDNKRSIESMLKRSRDRAKLSGPVEVGAADPASPETLLSEFVRPRFKSDSRHEYAAYLAGWKVCQDFRTDGDALVRQPVVSRNEGDIDANGQNLGNILHTLYTGSPRFEQDINDAMNAAFGARYEKLVFPPDTGDNRVQLQVRWKGLSRATPAADLSDGTLRFLYLMAILANPTPPPLIAIDEPEAGLHPSMLGVIAEFAAETAEKSQVIVTTHSADLLDSLTRFKPTTHVVELQNGETQIRTLSEEKLEYWLKGYTLGELYRSTELETLV